MFHRKVFALSAIAGISLTALVHAEVVLHPIPKRMYGDPPLEGPGSIDACSRDMLVAAFGNGTIYRIDLKEPAPGYIEVAGDSASLLKRGLRGSTIKCLDSNTFYLRDTWKLYRIRLDGAAIDTLGPVMREIVYNLVNDTSDNLYIVAGQHIYKVEDTLRQIARAPGSLWNMAIRDSNEFMGVGNNYLYHFQNGGLDSIPSPRGYQWFGCLWIRDRYLVRDRGIPSQAYSYDPIKKELKKLATHPDFMETAWGIHELAYTRFEDKDIVVSGGNPFMVNDTAVFAVEVRHESDASPIEDATFSATFPKFKEAYLLSGGRIGKIVSAVAVPVGLTPFRRDFFPERPKKPKLFDLSGYRIDGVSLSARR